MIHAQIQEFPSGVYGGGGGGSRSIWHIKKALTFLFSLVLNLFHRSPVVTFKKNYYLPRFQWVWNIFRGGGGGGGPTFYRGVQLLFPYRNPYNL